VDAGVFVEDVLSLPNVLLLEHERSVGLAVDSVESSLDDRSSIRFEDR
jgi:hypothetical protein